MIGNCLCATTQVKNQITAQQTANLRYEYIFTTMQPVQSTTDNIELSLDSAQREFGLLVSAYRHRALWFMKPDLDVDIASPDADLILDQIAAKATRSTWLAVRKLKRWRLQNIK